MSRSVVSSGGARRARLVLGATLLGVYGAFVLVVAVWPTPVDRGSGESIAALLTALHRLGVPGFFDYGWLEFCANVAFFAPVGVALGLIVTRRRWAGAVLAAAALSAGIELVQLFFLPERFASVLDVAANTLGAAAGVAVAMGARALARAGSYRRIGRSGGTAAMSERV